MSKFAWYSEDKKEFLAAPKKEMGNVKAFLIIALLLSIPMFVGLAKQFSY